MDNFRRKIFFFCKIKIIIWIMHVPVKKHMNMSQLFNSFLLQWYFISVVKSNFKRGKQRGCSWTLYMSVIWLINKRATNNLFTHILEFKNETIRTFRFILSRILKKAKKIKNERLHTSDKHIIKTKKNNVEIIDVWRTTYTFFLSKFYRRCKKGVKNKIKN